MSRFAKYRAWITRQRSDLQDELSVLQDLETDRTALFSGSAQRVADRAVLEAAPFSAGDNVRPLLEARATEIMTSSVPLGLNDSSPITSQDASKKFVSESLVLTGLAVKAASRDFVQGALQTAITAGLEQVRLAKVAGDLAVSLVGSMASLAVGQGNPLPPTDPRISGVIKSLDQAKDGATRMLANVNAPQALTSVLALAVQGFLNSALSTLGANTGALGAVTAQAEALIAAGEDLVTREASLAAYRKNLSTFRASYEARVTGFASDRAQAAGLATEIGKLRDAIDAARTLTELSSFRPGWVQELAILLALTRESKTESASTVFALEPDLADAVDGLNADIALIPDTDLSNLGGALLAMRAYLTGSSKSAETQSRYDLAVSTAQSLLTVLMDRFLATETALLKVQFDATGTVDQILGVMEGVKATVALDALQVGDIAGFLNAGVGTLNPADDIAGEIQKFRSDGLGKRTSLVRDLSEGLALIHSFETDDILADQGFEASRLNAISALEDDLQRLDRLQSVIDRADRAR